MATTDNVYIPQQGLLSELADWIAGDLGAAYARLYTSFVVPAPGRVCADFTEASWAGYAALGSIAWVPPFVNLSGSAETDSPVLTWSYSVGSGSVLAYGWYLTNLSLTKLLAFAPFLTPVELSPGSPTLSRSIQIAARSAL
jgi:hypothetical protein